MRFHYWVGEITILVLHFRVSSGPYLQIRLSRKGLPGDKQSSLSRQLINHGRKKFYNMRPVCQTFQRMSQVSYRLPVQMRTTGREVECCGKRVMAWAINLTVGQIFMAASERIIRDLIKMNIKIIFKN
jgi:hypothetical protein